MYVYPQLIPITAFHSWKPLGLADISTVHQYWQFESLSPEIVFVGFMI